MCGCGALLASRRTHAIVAANLATAERWFIENADFASWTPPRGGLLAMMRYNLDIPSAELADRLAAEYSVMLAPGSAFGPGGELFLRACFLRDPAQVEEAARRLAGYIASR